LKLCYIIGPYRGATVNEIHRNIQAAEDAAGRLWKAGFAVICPHKNSGYMDGVVNDNTFLLGGLRMIEGCDFVVVFDYNPDSKGSMREINYAMHIKKPIYWDEFEAIRAEGTE
jgi:hypothetical protein